MDKKRMGEKKLVSVIPSRLSLLDGGIQGILVGHRCSQCEEHFFGSVTYCRNCTSDNLEPVELGDRGTLYSYTIVHRPPAGWQGNVPYALGQVQVPLGPHILAEIVDCPFEQLEVGMQLALALVVAAEDAEGNEMVVYKWRPIEPSKGEV